ncbi:unnamed protein product [Adineta steineri]|uniref:C2 domain-containing protein n=1 Tax=Adineta steineri TaxID=433720 RepID=A0A814TF79_9BILA|nr:unnamed protein product [Adineta steineri]CAF1161064.1 unnamed protein product [Adineta steineri]
MAQLQVTIVEAINLKKKDLFSESDPFVQIYLDNKNNKYTTKVKHNTKNPHWNETFVLNVLNGQDILFVDVCDKDTIRHDKIGSLEIDLRDLFVKCIFFYIQKKPNIYLFFLDNSDKWYDLPATYGKSSHGKIHLVLEYQPLII